MKVLLACSVTPFSEGPHERRARELCAQLVAAGHESEILRVPFAATPYERLPSQLVMMRSFEGWNVDHLVALDLPAGLLRHPRKSLWLEALPGLPSEAGLPLRDLVGTALRQTLTESRGAFCTTYGGADLLRATLDVDLHVLPLPPRVVAATAGEYILAAPPRVPGDTRLLAALAQTDPAVRLRMAGQPASSTQEQTLRATATALGIAGRVNFDLRDLTEQEADSYLAAAVAVVCAGGANDSDLAIAAAGSGKALIADADNRSRLLRPRLSGWLAPASSADLAAVLNEAWLQRHRTMAYGERGRDLVRLSGATWSCILETLLA